MPGSPAKQDDLSLAAGGEPPAIKQQRQLLLAPNKRSYVGCVPGLKATLGRDLGSDPKSSEGLGKTLEGRCLNFLEVEETAQKPARTLGNRYRPGLRQVLQTSGQVEGLADGRFLTRAAPTNEVADHHQASGDPDTRCQSFTRRCSQGAHRGDCGEAGPNGSLRLILMRFRPAEIYQNAITHELRHVPLETEHLSRYGILVGS